MEGRAFPKRKQQGGMASSERELDERQFSTLVGVVGILGEAVLCVGLYLTLQDS